MKKKKDPIIEGIVFIISFSAAILYFALILFIERDSSPITLLDETTNGNFWTYSFVYPLIHLVAYIYTLSMTSAIVAFFYKVEIDFIKLLKIGLYIPAFAFLPFILALLL